MTLHRWLLAGLCAVALVFVVVAVKQFAEGRLSNGWWLLTAAVLLVGSYVTGYIWGWRRERRRRATPKGL